MGVKMNRLEYKLLAEGCSILHIVSIVFRMILGVEDPSDLIQFEKFHVLLVNIRNHVPR